jgi:hypothetical protein
VDASKFLKTRVTRDIKARVAEMVSEQLLTESIWLRRLVLRELQAGGSMNGSRHRFESPVLDPGEECSKRPTPGSSLYIRLRPDDRLLLHERAAARGMASATYISVLVRSHLRALAPLPRDEVVALKRAVSELGAVGRNLNQIARAANQGARVGGAGNEAFRAMLKICEALRDHTKSLIKVNAASWASGHAESTD